MKKRKAISWQSNKGFVLLLALMMMFRSAIADWSDVPTGSMNPTIVEGDRIFINKMAYDIRIPFSSISLLTVAQPKAGDIVVFDSMVADKRLVKRIIGVPGDSVQLIDNRLRINGVLLHYSVTEMRVGNAIVSEHLVNASHRIQIGVAAPKHANFAKVTVPRDHYLVLGDNRDNSADSRFIGFVPRSEIIGRSTRVAFSLNYQRWLLPRLERFFKPL